jgi:hypothetical protein
MMYSYQTRTFLSVSVSTQKRDGIPQTQVRLTDPLSRDQGVNVTGKSIPNSHYEDIVVAPKEPEHSREHAVEVCGAVPGEYVLTLYERGNEFYRVEVGVDVTDFLSTEFHSHEGRTRRYRFQFTARKEQVDLTWLDKNGQPRLALAGSD